ncbi:MAG: bifunctional oligoribonuclease/PAP phosphatase NrnA [bacterium]
MTIGTPLWHPGEIPAALLEALKGAKRPLILTHVYPDGDALGSAVSIHRLLEDLGAAPQTILTHPVPQKLSFIDHDKVAEVLDGEPTPQQIELAQNCDLVVVVDTSEPDRLGHMRKVVEGCDAPRICIDHHLEGSVDFFDQIWCEPGSPSTGNLVLEVIQSLGCEMSQSSAESLFVAIATDTGWFRYSNSGSVAYRYAATLVESGVDPEPIFQRIFQSFSLQRTQLLGDLLASIQAPEENRIIYSVLTQPMRSMRGVDLEDLDGFVDSLGQIAGCEIVFLVVEVGPGRYKVSLRSRGEFSVHRIAAHFDGGGHAKAAGCRLEGSEEQVIENLLGQCRLTLDAGPVE